MAACHSEEAAEGVVTTVTTHLTALSRYQAIQQHTPVNSIKTSQQSNNNQFAGSTNDSTRCTSTPCNRPGARRHPNNAVQAAAAHPFASKTNIFSAMQCSVHSAPHHPLGFLSSCTIITLPKCSTRAPAATAHSTQTNHCPASCTTIPQPHRLSPAPVLNSRQLDMHSSNHCKLNLPPTCILNNPAALPTAPLCLHTSSQLNKCNSSHYTLSQLLSHPLHYKPCTTNNPAPSPAAYLLSPSRPAAQHVQQQPLHTRPTAVLHTAQQFCRLTLTCCISSVFKPPSSSTSAAAELSRRNALRCSSPTSCSATTASPCSAATEPAGAAGRAVARPDRARAARPKVRPSRASRWSCKHQHAMV
jgi:hypothetical protein